MADAAYYREYRRKRKEIAQTANRKPQTAQTSNVNDTKAVSLSSESAKSSPARAREFWPNKPCNFPEPRKARVPLCVPADSAVYFRATKLLLTGLSMGEVCEQIGSTRAALMEAAHVLGDVVGFNDVEQFAKRAVSDRIAREALAAGVAQERVVTVEEDGPKGVTSKRTVERSIDVAALRLAGEHIDPERHGKLASAAAARGAGGPVQIAVTFIQGGGGGGERATVTAASFAPFEPFELGAEQVEDVTPAPAVDAEPFDPDPAPVPVQAAPRARFNPFARQQPAQGDEIAADTEDTP